MICSKTRQTDERVGGLLSIAIYWMFVSRDLYIYCMALFINVKLMMMMMMMVMMMMMMMKVLNFGVQKIYVKMYKFKNCMKPNNY